MSDTVTVFSATGTDVITVVQQNTLLSTQSPATTDVVQVFTQPSLVSIIAAGARGPQGDPGAPGVPGGTYTQAFAVASDTWTAVHNLGFIPNVGVLGSDGKSMLGRVESNDETTTVVTFFNPVSGRIILT